MSRNHQHTTSTNDLACDCCACRIGEHVQSLAWDSRGERLAILCTHKFNSSRKLRNVTHIVYV